MDFMSPKSLAAFCRKLPHATKDIKWGKDLVFSIGGCLPSSIRSRQCSFKATPETFARLTRIDGVIPAPYVGRYHWVTMTSPTALPSDMLKELLKESYQLVAAGLPAKTRKKLGLLQ